MPSLRLDGCAPADENALMLGLCGKDATMRSPDEAAVFAASDRAMRRPVGTGRECSRRCRMRAAPSRRARRGRSSRRLVRR
jgi:hypothetical protein